MDAIFGFEVLRLNAHHCAVVYLELSSCLLPSWKEAGRKVMDAIFGFQCIVCMAS